MPAVVCGKRSSIFEELLHTTSPPACKRIRCSAGSSSSSGAASLRHCPAWPSLSPSSSASLSSSFPSFNLSNSSIIGDNNSGSISSTPLSHLRSLFPDIDPQLLDRALEASDNDLDSAIKSLNGFRVESADGNSGSAMTKSDTGSGTNVELSRDSAADNLPANGSEWVELLVREMMNASDVDDARARASRVLEVLEKSIIANAGAEAMESLQKENTALKEQVEVLLRENTILKRAVAIQHERQKESEGRIQELQQFKQLASRYQEQVRTLEVNNYALAMHLRQAQQSSSIPGRFHPDVL